MYVSTRTCVYIHRRLVAAEGVNVLRCHRRVGKVRYSVYNIVVLMGLPYVNITTSVARVLLCFSRTHAYFPTSKMLLFPFHPIHSDAGMMWCTREGLRTVIALNMTFSCTYRYCDRVDTQRYCARDFPRVENSITPNIVWYGHWKVGRYGVS